MEERNTRVRASQIRSVFPDDMEATNAFVDTYIAKYDQATGKFTWVALNAHTHLEADITNLDHYDSTDFDTDFSGKDLDDLSDGSVYKRLKVDNFTIKENSNTIKVADRLELNPMLLAFKMSVNEGESKFNMINGFIDEYEDETGIDTATGQSTGQTYDSTNDLYKPTPGGSLEVDYCEYSTDELAQANWETSSPGGLNSDTKLLLHGNGVDASLEILDNGNTGHITTQNGNATLSTVQKKFGSSACYLDGTGDYLSIPDHDDFNFGTGNFVIDGWVKWEGSTGDEIFHSSAITNHGVWFEIATNTALIIYIGNGSTWTITATIEPVPAIGTSWHHFAVVRSGNDFYVFWDGTQEWTTNNSLTIGHTGNFEIGNGYSDYYFEGYIDEFRVSKGTDRGWTGATITLPTSAHTSDANTKLLLHMNTQDVSGDGTSGNYHIPTFYGTMQLDTAEKKWGSGSYKFDGDSDYITFPDSNDWDICGSAIDDWTIDLWVKFTDHVGGEDIISQWENDQNYLHIWHSHGNGFGFQVYSGGVAVISLLYGTEITDSNWHHVALIKVADEYAFYVDGNQSAYVQDSSIATTSAILHIGSYHGSDMYFDGYMDEIRIQHSNIFGAIPNVGLTNTITIPTGEHGDSGLMSYSEDTIKQQGSYSLKIIANTTDSLNENVRNTFSSSKNLSSYSFIKFDIRASRTGTNLQMRLHDETTGSVILTKDIEIATGEEDTWKTITWDISGETGINLDQIDYIELKITNADAENTIYLDNIYAGSDPSNMVLISEAYNAEADPDTARLVLFVQDIDTITVGTDIKGYISKDDGSTWAEVTLINEGDYNNNIHILSGIVDLTQTGIGSATGYPIRYKVQTFNQKDLKLHGVGANYD